MRQRWIAMMVGMLAMLTGFGGPAATAHASATDPAAVTQATEAANAWLKLIDDGEYEQSWEDASSLFRDAIASNRWSHQVAAVREPMGKLVSRRLKTARYATSLPGAPDGKYVVIRYVSSFENKRSAIETVTPMLDADGKWHVSGYFIK